MLSNWTKSTTTTTGTGTLTLSAVSGFPRHSDAFVVGAFVSYSIVTSDGKFESGIGKVAATNTLERTRVTATYNGSTYNNTTATALSLAAGTHTVIVDRISELGQTANPFPVVSGPTNPNLPSAHLAGTAANIALAAAVQTPTAWPYRLETSGLLTAFSLHVASGNAASQTVHIGLYEIGSDGYPGRRIARTSSTIDTSTTGYKSQAVSSNVFVNPGWYWIAVCHTNTGTVCNCTGVSTQVFATTIGNSGNTPVINVRSGTTATDLADPFPTTNKVWVTTTGVPYLNLILS